jgi:hypothetical protein
MSLISFIAGESDCWNLLLRYLLIGFQWLAFSCDITHDQKNSRDTQEVCRIKPVAAPKSFENSKRNEKHKHSNTCRKPCSFD